MKRRRFLTLAGAAAALSGCSQNGETDNKNTTSKTNDTSTVQPDHEAIKALLNPVAEGDPSESAAFNGSDREGSREFPVDFSKAREVHDAQLELAFQDENDDWKEWLETLPDDSKYSKIKKQVTAGGYPFNKETEEEKDFHTRFKFDHFSEAENLGIALDWLQPYLNSWDNLKPNGELDDELSRPEEANKYAPLLEEAITRFTDVNTIFWPLNMFEVKTDGDINNELERDGDHRYGSMAAWDLDSDELYIVQSYGRNLDFLSIQGKYHRFITGKEDQIEGQRLFTYPPGRDHHQKAERSVHLPEFGKDPEYNGDKAEEAGVETVFDLTEKITATEYWHPFRFDGDEPDVEGLDYREAAVLRAQSLRRMTADPESTHVNNIIGEDAGVAFTNGYLSSLPPRHQMESAGQEHFAQSVMAHELAESDGYFIGLGSFESPVYAEVDDPDLVESVWNDEAGELDGLSQ